MPKEVKAVEWDEMMIPFEGATPDILGEKTRQELAHIAEVTVWLQEL